MEGWKERKTVRRENKEKRIKGRKKEKKKERKKEKRKEGRMSMHSYQIIISRRTLIVLIS